MKISHENNFDILRVFAASVVLFSHSWPLSGHYDEPIVVATKNVIGGGALGVWIFFFISGLLVTESFLRRGIFAYFEARILRIFPGLAVCLLFGIAIGAIVTTLPLSEYLSQRDTWRYFYQGLQLDIRYELPGVFATNPMPKAVNGSLWTLATEFVMYVVLAAIGLTTALKHRYSGSAILLALLIALSINPEWATILPKVGSSVMVPAIRCFLIGALFCLNRDRIPLHWTGAMALCLLTYYISHDKPFGAYHGALLVCLTVSYISAWLAFHPRLRVRIPEKFGDTSYGLYMYAFPIQQVIALYVGGISPWAMIPIAWFATVVLAWFSWHYVEKPALQLKGRVGQWFDRRRSA